MYVLRLPDYNDGKFAREAGSSLLNYTANIPNTSLSLENFNP